MLAPYMRQLSDIPFATDIAELLHSREVFETLLQGHELMCFILNRNWQISVQKKRS
jgi:hypothetical protein